ncbi:HutD family protein [Mesorhizobium sp. BAC0120]|uniref:HutD/Ves family protein n=1 Tax=Mesorhizobium sp. BAC0120 TaxID=3090670 RepID=UPI00298CCF40|nr:HutD family protein [Mesorhizobium sp. BAC0120]MDW6020857.1 HutD family protein [Mesorhizobium sp. BAC0120]
MPEALRDNGVAESGVFRLADRVFQPWKNGGGETAEIAVSPAGADFETFDWRLSTAVVAKSGPFSTFAGVDRVLTVLEGGAMVLSVDGREHRLDATCEPFCFSGDVTVVARLESQRLLDFNVMVRRPLQAEVVRGPIDFSRRRKNTRARFALLLEDRVNLARLDLVDLEAVTPSLAASLVGTQALDVQIFG